jgi:hypothetical protein
LAHQRDLPDALQQLSLPSTQYTSHATMHLALCRAYHTLTCKTFSPIGHQRHHLPDALRQPMQVYCSHTMLHVSQLPARFIDDIDDSLYGI